MMNQRSALEVPMSEESFIAFEREVAEMSDKELLIFCSSTKLAALDEMTSGDGCSGCVFEAMNAWRAVGLGLAEMRRR